MLHIALCDDDKKIISELEDCFDRIAEIKIESDSFYNADDLLRYINTTKNEYDLYILDIEMPGMSGIELSYEIRKRAPYALIVFLTSYKEYVYNVFEVVTFDYIAKPVDCKRINKLILRVTEYLGTVKTNFHFSYRKNSYSIQMQEIAYIGKAGRKAYINTNNHEVYHCNMRLEEIWNQLDSHQFMHIHISCIVNIGEIKKVEKTEIELKNGTKLYAGRRYVNEIKRRQLEYLTRGF
ncbi:DNA-binding LytR/AlgR family response regulator [Lachnospiraceae bacterium PF1-21]